MSAKTKKDSWDLAITKKSRRDLYRLALKTLIGMKLQASTKKIRAAAKEITEVILVPVYKKQGLLKA